jgi:hypothetical protein
MLDPDVRVSKRKHYYNPGRSIWLQFELVFIHNRTHKSRSVVVSSVAPIVGGAVRRCTKMRSADG